MTGELVILRPGLSVTLRRRYIVSVALGVTAVAMALAVSSRAYTAPVGDERRFSIPSMLFQHSNGRPLVYLYSNAYMAPVQETLATTLYFKSGENIQVLRLFGAIFVGLACSLLYLQLRSIYDADLALAVAIAFAIPSTALCAIRLVLPGYPFGLLCCFSLLSLMGAGWPWGSLLKGISAGILHYCFPVLAPCLLVCFFLIAVRSTSGAGIFALRPGLAATASSAFGALCMLPALYFYLTRGRVTASFSWRIMFAGGFVITLASAAWWLLRAAGPKSSAALLARGGLLLSGFFCVLATHTYLFQVLDLPVIKARGVTLNYGGTYRLKAWKALPAQISFAVERILPMAVLPTVSLGSLRDRGTDAPEGNLPYLLAGLAIAGLGAFGALRLYRLGKRNSAGSLDKLIYPLSFLLSLVLLIPSWRLNSDYSVRYLIPTLPGLWILVFLGLQRFIPGKAVVALALLCAVAAATWSLKI